MELEGEGHHDTLAVDVCFMLFVMLLLGQIMKSVAEVTGLPYTSLITVCGVVLGVCSVKYAETWGRIGKAIVAYSNFPPHLLLLVFLPPLIFESAFNSDWHIFKVELW
jgi:NhaP-type Na+/H+ or K+/H+ antiporter